MIILFVIFAGICVAEFNGEHMWPSWTAVVFCTTLIMAWNLKKKFHFSVGLAFLAIMMSALRIFGSPYANAGFEAQGAVFDVLALYSGLTLFCFAAMFLSIKADKLKHLEIVWEILVFWNSGLTIYQYLKGQGGHGFFWNESMNASFIAYVFPLVAFCPNKLSLAYDGKPISVVAEKYYLYFIYDLFALVLPVWAIYASQATVPMLVFVVGCSVNLLFGKHRSRILQGFASKTSCAISFVGVCFVAGKYFIPQFENDSGRFSVWRLVLKWKDQNWHWFGMGDGSFFMWGPYIQKQNNTGMGNWWAWAHNDFLQVFFESGIIGLGAVLLLCYFLFRRTLQDKTYYLTASLCAYLCACFFNFPMRLGGQALFGAWLLARIFTFRGENDREKTGITTEVSGW